MRPRHIFNYLLIQQYYFYGLAQAFAVFLLSLYFFTGIQSTSMVLGHLLIIYVPLLLTQFGIQIWLQRFNVDPKTESGLLLKGRILALAAWPVYFIALTRVIRHKRLTYKVTPKGGLQRETTNIALFKPHMVMGAMTTLGIVVSFFTHHQAPELLFVAAINSVAMGIFIYMAFRKRIFEYLEEKFPNLGNQFPSLFGRPVSAK